MAHLMRPSPISHRNTSFSTSPRPEYAESSTHKHGFVPESGPSAPRKRSYTRSTRGCWGCRESKVKCDETMPSCRRCSANHRSCRWPSADELAHPRKSRRAKNSAHSEPATDRPLHESPRMTPAVQLPHERRFSRPVEAYHTIKRPYDQDGDSLRGQLWENPFPGVSTPPAPHTLPERYQAASLPVTSEHPSGYTLANMVSEGTGVQEDTLPSLTNSLLASRRLAKGKSKDRLPELVPSEMQGLHQDDHTVAGIDLEMLASALDHQPPLIELGPLSSNTPIPQHASADALRSAFPSPLALQLFHHFCNSACRILIAMGNNGSHKNPILSLCTPQRLLDTSSAAAAALRMSMLSVSIAHIENEVVLKNQRRHRGGVWIELQQRVHEVGKRLKTAAQANIVLVEEDETDQFDTLLASCVILLLRDVISGSGDWESTIDYAIRLVAKRGGPQAVLNSDKSNFTRRFLLENLATHDIFSCFVTQKEPALIGRFDPWWYSCVETSTRSWEWESVERTFGMSRGMVEFMARVVTLDAQKLRLGIDFNTPTSGLNKVEEFMRRQAEGLLLELDVWCNGLSSSAQHSRVTCGDYIYKYTATIFILGEILGHPTDSLRIVESIDYVLELCSEVREVVQLIWPLLICGTMCESSKRDKLLSLMDVFADEYCEDLRVAVSHLIGVSLPMDAKILVNASASSHGRTVEMYRFWFRETALLGGDEKNRSIRFVDLSRRLYDMYDVDMPCAPRFCLFGEKARLSGLLDSIRSCIPAFDHGRYASSDFTARKETTDHSIYQSTSYVLASNLKRISLYGAMQPVPQRHHLQSPAFARAQTTPRPVALIHPDLNSTDSTDAANHVKEYEEKRDRLHQAILSASYLLGDLRNINEQEWSIRYPTFMVHDVATAKHVPGSAISSPKRTLTMSFADEPVKSQEIVIAESDANNANACGTGSHIIKRKTLHRSLTFAPNGNTATRDSDLLGSRATPVLEDMTDFSILRLDLSLGHGHNVASRAGTIMSSLERNSISRLLSSRIESSLSHLENIRERIMSTRSRVLVTGDLNAGKSTFVNALLRRGGRDDDGWPSGVMPVDQQPLTGRFVEVFGEENETAQVPEQVHVVKGIEADYDLEDEATFEKKAVSDLPDLVAEQAANAPPLKVYLRSPSTDLANPSILHNGILDISLIDAPGLNRDVIPTTSTFTRSPTIDVIIFVVSASNHFTLSAKEFILSAGQEKARMFIVVNRFDEVRDKEKCKRIVLEQIKQLSPKTWAEREDLVHFVDSATVALRQSEACNDNTITTAAVGQEQELDLAFHHLESSLRSFVLINRAKSKLGPAENYLCHLLADVELLSSANAVVAEETRDKAIQDQNRVKPSLQAMLKNRSSLEEALDKEEETIGQEIDTRVRRDLKLALSAIGTGRTAPDCGISLPPYPGFMGLWDYAAMVRTALLTSFEVKIAQLEEQTRTHTANSIHALSIIGDRYLPSDAERTVRIFNSKALFPSAQSESNSRTRRISQSRSSSVGLGLLARSDLTNASPSDIFDLNHYILAAKTTLAGGSHSPEGHDGELTLLKGLSLAAGAFTIFGGKALGLRGALDSMVALTDAVGHRAARQWAAPVVGVLIVSMSIYVIQDLPAAIPRNVGRQLRQALQAASDSYSEQTGAVDYVEYQSTRMQREARKVIRLASWDLRERFRAALDKKSMILRESEEEEKRATKAMQNFAALQTRSNEIKSAMGKSVFI